jgi:hypothetical protein
VSRPIWRITAPVTGPVAASRRKLTWASTTFQKKSFGRSAKISYRGYPVSSAKRREPSWVTTILTAGAIS